MLSSRLSITNLGEASAMMSNDVRTSNHLKHLIRNRNDNVSTFSLLLGSGASFTSGVRTAEDMISGWRGELFRRAEDDDYQDWLSGQEWYDDEDEYSLLFESVYDQPSQRRTYIEQCIKDARPGWGYVYLTNLLSKKFFDVVFTTNFDDLINEACYLYSEDLRPIVAAHDSAIQGVRLTSRRPKIIKVHGDFLYDNIKNTLGELEVLEVNTKRKLAQFAQEYGLVVIGYSGRDRSVMDTIELLLTDENNYREGIYWCTRRDSSLSRRLQRLLRRDRVYLVEIDGFDEFMAELHNEAGLSLAKPVARPFDMARDRANLLLVKGSDSLDSHPVIADHVNEVLTNLANPTPSMPSLVEATLLSAKGDFSRAVQAWKKAYEEEPEDSLISYEYAEALADAGMHKELSDFALKGQLTIGQRTYFLLRAGHNREVIDLASDSLDEPATLYENRLERAVVRINRAIALKRLGDTDVMSKDLEQLKGEDLDNLKKDKNDAWMSIQAGIAALEGDRQALFEALGKALHVALTPTNLTKFPVFEDYQDDPEFLELAKSKPRRTLSN